MQPVGPTRQELDLMRNQFLYRQVIRGVVAEILERGKKENNDNNTLRSSSSEVGSQTTENNQGLAG